jgi:GT2 family glycosyltransferase
MSLSVIVPTFKNPTCLDLCLKSLTENKTVDNTQIIVVVDGEIDVSKRVLKKYANHIDVLEFPENKGQTEAHNQGVIAAERKWVLILNDDNIAPFQFDEKLLKVADKNKIITPNQVEPTPSIFKSFIHTDFGRTPETFEYEQFINVERKNNLPSDKLFTIDGQTWPVFMSKKWWMILGGIDPAFPNPAVSDWDFFMRCEMAGLECVRYHGLHFYHFGGVATKVIGNALQHNDGERKSFEYFYHKWGFMPRMNPQTHSKLNGDVARGIVFA